MTFQKLDVASWRRVRTMQALLMVEYFLSLETFATWLAPLALHSRSTVIAFGTGMADPSAEAKDQTLTLH